MTFGYNIGMKRTDAKYKIYMHQDVLIIVMIDWLEEQNRSDIRFWTNTLSAKQLTEKLRKLKYLLKRIEYGTTEHETEYALIRENYSQYAVTVTCDYYHITR